MLVGVGTGQAWTGVLAGEEPSREGQDRVGF